MSGILGFHVIGCTYGFWLPNEERGSGSDLVRSDALAKFGPANPVTHRRSVARKPYDYEVRRMALQALRYPPVLLTNAQIAAVGRGVTREIETYSPAAMHAFVQLRDHFHYVCGPCRYDIRRFEGRLKGAATKQLLEEGIHPMQKFADKHGNIPSPWSVKPWVVYLFTRDDVVRSINYANDNLIRSRLAPQVHSFIVPYGGTRGAAHRR
jgi:hypothetical protein